MEAPNNKPIFQFLPNLCTANSVLSLVVMGELVALALILFEQQGARIDWATFGATSLLIQWILLASVLLLCRCRTLLNQLPRLLAGSLAFTSCLLVAALVLGLAQTFFTLQFDIIQWIKSLLIAAIFFGIWLRYIYLQQQLHYQKQAEVQSRLSALQARIQPHFLFNSMNTIASLITINPTLAEECVERLSDLFRASLNADKLVLLEEEVQLCQDYLHIEGLRLGAERLRCEWSIVSPIPILYIPSLLLQPLFENAIIHGIQPRTEGGTITCEIETNNDSVLISIVNPIPVKNDIKTSSNYMALENITHRLQAQFGKHAKINTTQNKKSFQVSITLPLDQPQLS